jgi:uncharacterized protein YjbJ (UPF0337 family)
MNPTSIVRDVVSKSIAVARLPLDMANGLLGSRGLGVDDVDGRVRESVGTLVGDDKLRAEGARRRAATKQRAKAERLRADAGSRETAAARESAKSREKVSELEDRARLEQLKDESEALGEREDAQVTADEAKRLKAAAERVKETRKSRASA